MTLLSVYDLADAELISSCRERAVKGDFGQKAEHHVIQYKYDQTAVVIGASNKAETSVHQRACLDDGIKVMQRPSGGEAVIISPNTLLFSHIMLGADLPKSRDFFMENLGYFEADLRALGVVDLRFNGISDLCIGQKKILGCAIYRRPGMVLWQAVLNLSEDPSRIARYLAVPARMPDYRKRRPHQDFVTSLAREGYLITSDDLDIPASIGRSGIAPLYRY